MVWKLNQRPYGLKTIWTEKLRPKNWDGFNSGLCGARRGCKPFVRFWVARNKPMRGRRQKNPTRGEGAICYIAEHGNTIAMGWCSQPEQRGSSGQAQRKNFFHYKSKGKTPKPKRLVFKPKGNQAHLGSGLDQRTPQRFWVKSAMFWVEDLRCKLRFNGETWVWDEENVSQRPQTKNLRIENRGFEFHWDSKESWSSLRRRWLQVIRNGSTSPKTGESRCFGST